MCDEFELILISNESSVYFIIAAPEVYKKKKKNIDLYNGYFYPRIHPHYLAYVVFT